MQQNPVPGVLKTGGRRYSERISILVGEESGVVPQVGVERNGGGRRVVVREGLEEDVEEEEVGVGDGEEEVVSAAKGVEVGEPVGELGEEGEVVLEALDDGLRVGLAQLGDGGGALQ